MDSTTIAAAIREHKRRMAERAVALQYAKPFSRTSVTSTGGEICAENERADGSTFTLPLEGGPDARH